MPFIPVPAAILAELVHQTPGGQAVNTLWFTSPLTHDASLLGDLVTMLEGWFATDINPLQSSQVELVSIKATSQISDTSPAIEYPLTPPIVGADASPVLPSNVTAAVTFLTAFRGRSNRGRNYVIGLGEGHISGDELTDAMVNAYVAGYLGLIADASAAGFTWVVASRYSGVDANGDPIPRVSGQTTPVTNVKMDNTVDSQRRRLRHRGL